VIWCSNDYLAMGQYPKVIGAMVETVIRMGTGGAARVTSPAPSTAFAILLARR
jgi:7-keto-8-aminopelargonate synthetase-like enzyme